MSRTNSLLAQGVIQDHPIEVALFDRTGPITLVWLVIRLWLGWQWVEAGLEKINNPGWMNGNALAGFWQGSISSYGKPHSNVAYDWYVGFLQGLSGGHAESWFAPLVAYGELLAGIALIVGLFTGIAALAAAFLNFNFMLAGSSGVNPVYFMLAILLVMAWKNAGWIGLDRFVLPKLGTPWHAGAIFHRTPPANRTIAPEA
ncbi:MAG: DoxX family membrane protein [Chloroflexota bacterium]|nr:DoxX family membrane protein [Chloroflexota bacterium]